jgi:peptidoglycan/LPS O-acetylase OafA/YrhL
LISARGESQRSREIDRNELEYIHSPSPEHLIFIRETTLFRLTIVKSRKSCSMRKIQRTADSVYQYRYFGGFRLLLATLVMAQHFGADLAPAALAVALAPFAIGNVAVLVFFALSGFVITEAIDSVYRQRPGAFLSNRMLRIVPHFVLAVALAMLAHELFRLAGGVRLWRSQPSFPDDAFALPNVLLNFLEIVPLGKRLLQYDFLTITWAIRVEMAFYVAMSGCIIIGRRLPWPRGFALAAGVLALLLLPAAWLAVHRSGPEMLMYTPYFVFGSGLYFATVGSRIGWITALLCVPIMLWQFVGDELRIVPIQGIPLSLTGNLITLIILLAIMTALAFVPIAGGRTTDRMLGNLTYPLYLYHEVVLIVVLTFTTGYAYSTLAIGFALSLATAALMMALVDPAVTRYRDRIRGKALHPARVSAERPDFAIPLLPTPR